MPKEQCPTERRSGGSFEGSGVGHSRRVGSCHPYCGRFEVFVSVLLSLGKSVLCFYVVLSGKYLPPFGRIVVPSFLALKQFRRSNVCCDTSRRQMHPFVCSERAWRLSKTEIPRFDILEILIETSSI